MKYGPESCWEMSEEAYLREANPMKAMISANRLHRAKVEKAFEGTGLHRAQHRTLMVLSRNEYQSQVELAKALEVSTATLAVSLKKLERDGYIQKTAKAEDSRAKFVTLTDKGKEVVEKSRTIFEAIDTQAILDFSEEELVQLRSYLKRIYENLSEK
nr:MarR family transcriptional regulator [Eubacterium sp.]